MSPLFAAGMGFPFVSRNCRKAAFALLLAASWLAAPHTLRAQRPATATLLIKTVPNLPAEQAQAAVNRHGATWKKAIPKLDLHVVEVPAAAVEAFTRNAKADPLVRRVESSRPRKMHRLPADPLVAAQWALPRISWDNVFGVTAPRAWTKVALLDTGIDPTHPDLVGVTAPGVSIIDDSNGLTDLSGHGTWLAGIVAAKTNNGAGIAGVAFDYVQVMPVKVISPDGLGQDADIIQGLLWAVDNGASVVLMAFSSPGFSESLQEAIDYAWARNVVLVAAAGNDAANVPTFPAGDRGVIGVSATTPTDTLASFSNFGPSVFLAAPGVDILGTSLNAAYSSASGTSSAAAIVAASAALLRATDPSLSNGVIVNRLARTADPAGTQEQSGNGRVQIQRALAETSTEFIQPAGAAPLANGGPFVGPYKTESTAVTIGTVSGFPKTVTANASGEVTLMVGYNFSVTLGDSSTGFTYRAYLKNGGTTVALASITTCTTPSNPYTGSVQVTLGGAASQVQTWDLIVDTTRCGGSGQSDAKTTNAWVTVNPPPQTGGGTLTVGAQSGTATIGGSSDSVSFFVDATRTSNGTFNGTYTASGLPTGVSASFNPTSFTANGSTAFTDSSLSLTVGSTVPAGSYTFNVTLTDSGSGSAITNTGTLVVGRARTTTVVLCPSSATYNGAPQTPCSASVTSPLDDPGFSQTLTVAYSNNTNAGTATASAAYAESANYLASSDSKTFTINPAPVTATAGNYTGIYDAATHALTACQVTGAFIGPLSCANSPAGPVGPDFGSGTVTPVVNYGAESPTNFLVTPANGSWSITRKPVTPQVTAASRTYNGTDSASILTCTLDGNLDGANLTCSAPTATFNNRNVGDGKTVNATGISLGGSKAGNYSLTATTATTTANITKADLYLTAVATTKTYDGTTSSAGTPTVSGLQTGDSVTGLAQVYNNKDAGSNKTMSVSAYTVNDGNSGNNYNVILATNSTGVINPAPVTATAGSYTGIYDAATHALTDCQITGAFTGPLTCANTPAGPVGPDFGSGTVTPVVNYGAESPTNFLVTPANGSWSITRKPVTPQVTAANRTYNGTDSASIVTCTLDGNLDGANLTCSAPTATFANKNVGDGKLVNATGISLGGSKAGNYSLTATTATTTANITKADLYLTAVATTKTYDGNVTSNGVPAVSGLQPGDSVTGLAQVYNNKDAGSIKTMSVSAYTVNDGNSGNNYNVILATAPNGVINPAPVTATAGNYTGIYDAATHALTACQVTGVFTGPLTCANDPVGPVGPDFGSGTVTPVVNYGAESPTNFLVTPANGSWRITQKPVTPQVTAANRTYNGTTSASILTCTLDGNLDGANLTCSAPTATFNNRNVGDGKTVTASGISLGGSKAGNYSLTATTATTTANITRADLSITAVATTKTYDGTTSSAGTPTVAGLQPGDSVTGLTQVYDDKNAGVNKTMSVSTYTVNDGNSGNNYNVKTYTNPNGVILQANSSIVITCGTPTYTGAALEPCSAKAVRPGDADLTGLPITYANNTNAGTNTASASAAWAGGPNHTGSTATVSFSIAKAPSITTIDCPATFMFSPPNTPCTAIATGAGILTGTPVISYLNNASVGVATATATYAGDLNHNGSSASATFTITPRPAYVKYIGQTSFVTSGSSATTAQVTLSASLQDPTGLVLTGAKADFFDITNGMPGVLLAGGVTVSPVANSPATGTANKIVTLSTGQYGAAQYLILVKVAGNYTNDDQSPDDRTAEVVVSKPTGANQIIGGGKLGKTGGTIGSTANKAGIYGQNATGDVTFSVGINYNKQMTNLQGQIMLTIPQSDGTIVVVKSNSLSSMQVASMSGGKKATVYTKSSVTKYNLDGTTTSQGNVTLRMDLEDFTSPSSTDKIGFTVLSNQDSTLFYSNDWVFDSTNTWKTQPSLMVTGGTVPWIG